MNKSRDCLPFYDCLMCRLYYIVNGGWGWGEAENYIPRRRCPFPSFLPNHPTVTAAVKTASLHVQTATHTHRPFVLTVCVCVCHPGRYCDVSVLCVCVCVIDPTVGKKVESFLFYFQPKKHPQLGSLSIVPPRVSVCLCVCVCTRASSDSNCPLES